ncbi:hypothetical protein ACFWHQ_40665 [Streptomyces sp. NPDC060334]|uniref:hypothetical protein n=1 Tax=Streptomyces sp. NPDC060334 TaxID=3347099 RepID=UPI00365E2E42
MATALREVDNLTCAGRLARILDDNAVIVLHQVTAEDPSLYSLHRLVDALAAAAEGPPYPSGRRLTLGPVPQGRLVLHASSSMHGRDNAPARR